MKNIQAIFSLSILVVGLAAMGTAVSLHNVPTVSSADVEVELGQGDIGPAENTVHIELNEMIIRADESDDGVKGGVARRKKGVSQPLAKERRSENRSKCFWHTPRMGERIRVCDSNYIPPEEPEATKRDYAAQTAEISIGFEGLLK